MKEINTSLKAKSISYGSSRSTSSIKYLIYHYTGNSTDTAKANANYFANGNTRAAGAHYFVDATSIYQSIDDLKTAWAVGGSKQSSYGGTMYGTITNYNSISIEMCSTNGAISEETQKNAVELGQYLMQKYDIPISRVYRHFDVNGKICPGWDGWTTYRGQSDSKWSAFKAALENKNITEDTAQEMAFVSTETPFRVRVKIDDLNIRKGPGTNYSKRGIYTGKGVFTIVETATGKGSDKGWGLLKSYESARDGWISLDYCEVI